MDKSLTIKRELVQQLIRDVRNDLEDYAQLKNMLEQQRQLMQRRDNESLLTHNTQQTLLCDKLAKRASVRSQHLSQLGFDNNPGGMTKLISKLPEHIRPQIKLLWQNLQAIVQDSQQQNEANGKLLVMQQTSIKRILGQDSQEAIDYGANTANHYGVN
ncbi:flagellar protein FlgN [Shewanella sp. SR44-3]|uniref:flagellar protein FlgN n=1 Tax=unclassified Shewanella TaxID=196818 RepID=UPI0015FD4F0A|nr:flagellar protein FlgN [Shewanella sp. SR44-3]MBB1268381.1 flagellar protein FlgN [Shewanella sp. SR44-3]